MNKMENTCGKGKKGLMARIFGTCTMALMMLVMVACSGGRANLPETRDIFTLQDTYNMTVVVVFDAEQPVVQFVAPDGRLVDMDSIRYREGSNFTQFFLPNAIPGVWQMNYDPLTNTEITTPYSVYMEHIFIRDFEAQMVRNQYGQIPVSFAVSADEAGEFRYYLYAVFTAPDNSIEKEVLLSFGYGMMNELLNLGVCVEDVLALDMGGFMLRLAVYSQYGQAAIRDSAWLDLRLG